MNSDSAINISVVIVTTNAIKHIGNCLASIYKYSSTNDVEIIVSDNNSNDGTVDYINRYFSKVKIICNEKNIGFGPANNRGTEISNGEYILFLNDDTILSNDIIKGMANYLDCNEEIGVLGPRLLNVDGSLQPSISNFPSATKDIVYALFPSAYQLNKDKIRYLLSYFFKEGNLGRYSKHNDICETDFPKGACMMIRKSILLDVGGFDENIFFYSEEADLSYRIKEKGWKIIYNPDFSLVHIGGVSTGKEIDKSLGRRFLQRHKSNLYFFKKHNSIFKVAYYRIGLTVVFITKIILLIIGKIIFLNKNKSNAKIEIYWNTILLLNNNKHNSINMFTELRLNYFT